MATKTKTDGKRSVRDDAAKFASAMSHPIRARALVALNARTSSPVQLATEFGETVNTVAYHVSVLARDGFVELVSTRPRRGSVEHFYRATQRFLLDDETWAALPANIRTSLSSIGVGEMLSDLGRALATGAFDSRTDRHLVWMRLRLDEQAWGELFTRLGEVFAEAQALEEASANRSAGDELISGRVILGQYTAPPADA